MKIECTFIATKDCRNYNLVLKHEIDMMPPKSSQRLKIKGNQKTTKGKIISIVNALEGISDYNPYPEPSVLNYDHKHSCTIL